MRKAEVGSTVIHEGAVWRVTELGENNIGEPIAQCECLDKDAFAAVKIDILEDAGLTAAQVDERIASRESRMLPVRIQSMRNLFKKQIETADAAKAMSRKLAHKADSIGDRDGVALHTAEADKKKAKVDYLTAELAKFNEGVSNV